MKRIAHIEDGFIVNVSLLSDDKEIPEGKMLETDAILAGYTRKPTSSVKTWDNVEYFMAEFNPDELADIQLSQDRTLATLKIVLSTWFSTVRADDERVLMGLGKLLELGIINQDRYNTILGL